MIYNVYDRGGRNTEPYVATLIADEESDFHEIDVGLYSPGTSILVIDSGTVYMLNSQKEWIPLGDGGGGGGGGGSHTHTATQIIYDPTGTTLISTNVQLAINELWTLIQSGGISGLHFIKVESLPDPASADTKGIYLLDTDVNNVYEMWIVDITGATPQWVILGDTSIDLSNYYTKTQTDTLLANKQNTLTWDTTPTSGSTNPVTSNGIYEALQNVTPVNIHRALTQAQYNALTPAQKNNGTEYFITDAQAEGDFSNIETRLHKMEANFIDVTPNLQMLDPASYVSITRVNDNQVDIIVHDEVTNKNWKVSVTSTGSGNTRSNPQYTITEVV